MPLTIPDDAIDELAYSKQLDKTEAARIALETELVRMDDVRQLRERMRPIQDRVASWPPSGA